MKSYLIFFVFNFLFVYNSRIYAIGIFPKAYFCQNSISDFGIRCDLLFNSFCRILIPSVTF